MDSSASIHSERTWKDLLYCSLAYLSTCREDYQIFFYYLWWSWNLIKKSSLFDFPAAASRWNRHLAEKLTFFSRISVFEPDSKSPVPVFRWKGTWLRLRLRRRRRMTQRSTKAPGCWSRCCWCCWRCWCCWCCWCCIPDTWVLTNICDDHETS